MGVDWDSHSGVGNLGQISSLAHVNIACRFMSNMHSVAFQTMSHALSSEACIYSILIGAAEAQLRNIGMDIRVATRHSSLDRSA